MPEVELPRREDIVVIGAGPRESRLPAAQAEASGATDPSFLEKGALSEAPLGEPPSPESNSIFHKPSGRWRGQPGDDQLAIARHPR
jgi:hypothetical protein